MARPVTTTLHPYTDRDVLLYALSVGADELELTWEGRGPEVLPGWLTTVAFAHSAPLLAEAGAREAGAVFVAQELRPAAPIPPAGTLTVDGEVEGRWTLGPLGFVALRHRFSVDGVDVGETACQIAVPGLVVPPGGRPPRTPRAVLPSRPPDWTAALPTLPTQALLFRLNGDRNALHVDPATAAAMAEVTGGRPILHGLCTFGFVARALRAAGRSGALRGRFSRPAWPGDTLRAAAWTHGDDWLVRVTTDARPDEDVFVGVA